MEDLPFRVSVEDTSSMVHLGVWFLLLGSVRWHHSRGKKLLVSRVVWEDSEEDRGSPLFAPRD